VSGLTGGHINISKRLCQGVFENCCLLLYCYKQMPCHRNLPLHCPRTSSELFGLDYCRVVLVSLPGGYGLRSCVCLFSFFGLFSYFIYVLETIIKHIPHRGNSLFCTGIGCRTSVVLQNVTQDMCLANCRIVRRFFIDGKLPFNFNLTAGLCQTLL